MAENPNLADRDRDIVSALVRIENVLTRIAAALERIEERQEQALGLLRSLDRSQWQ